MPVEFLIGGKSMKPKMQKIKVLRGVIIKGKDYFPGATVTVAEALARELILTGHAEIVESKPKDENKKDDKKGK